MSRYHYKYDTKETYYNRIPLRKHTSVMSKLEVDTLPVKSTPNDFSIKDSKGGRNTTKGLKSKGYLHSLKSSALLVTNSLGDSYTSTRVAKWNSVYKRVMVVNRFPKPPKRTVKIISTGQVSKIVCGSKFIFLTFVNVKCKIIEIYIFCHRKCQTNTKSSAI